MGTKNILVFSTMDEPIFKHFVAEKMLPFMKLLGMKEAEAIEHEMVSKSILRGEEKITKLVSLERTTCKFPGRMDGKEY